MALIKRGRTWHMHFVVDGVRYRQSLKTTDWREAQKRQHDAVEKAKAGKLAAKRKAIACVPFEDAAELFIGDRAPGLAPLSVRTERERARAINRVLGSLRVRDITPEDVLAYIRGRHEQKIANRTVNRELDVIRGVLKRAKCWHLFEDAVKPLPVTENIGRALLHEEKARLLRFAAM